MKGLPTEIIDFIDANEGRYLYGSVEVYFYEPKEMIEVNQDFLMAEYLPDFICIASNGCGGALFYRKSDGKLYSNAVIGRSEEDMIFVAEDLSDFIQKAENDQLEIH